MRVYMYVCVYIEIINVEKQIVKANMILAIYTFYFK